MNKNVNKQRFWEWEMELQGKTNTRDLTSCRILMSIDLLCLTKSNYLIDGKRSFPD